MGVIGFDCVATLLVRATKTSANTIKSFFTSVKNLFHKVANALWPQVDSVGTPAPVLA